MKETGKKHPNVQYQPPGRARQTFDIPELNKPPISGQVCLSLLNLELLTTFQSTPPLLQTQ